jgi:beta-glucosidase
MKQILLFTNVALIFSSMIFLGAILQHKGKMNTDKKLDPAVEEKIEELIGKLTLQEKISLLGGTGFATKPIDRLGIPELKMSDGPLGVRWGESTAFPAGTAMAASWDTSLIYKVGRAIAQELKGHGRNVLLGPCVNIARLPMGGRDFESYGEDPYLASRMAVGYIEGVQSEGVAATVKHFAANNQEYERMFVDVQVDHRTLNEIYFPAFKAAVEEAKVLCVMSAYNKINGHYCSENDYLLNTKLKKDWKFDGLVMSDWGAVHSTIPTANGGLDLEMPTGEYLNDSTLLDAVKSGAVKETTLNDKVRRILRVMFRLGLFDKSNTSHEMKEDQRLINTPEHRQIAYQAAVEGIVLLRNKNNILPLNLNKIKSIAIIGPNAATARTTGGGSAMVTPVYSISPLEALQNKIGNKVRINYAEGVSLSGDVSALDSKYFYLPDASKHGIAAEYYDNQDLKGKPKATKIDSQINFDWHGQSPLDGIPGQHFSARWTTRILADETDDYSIDVVSDDGIRLYVDGKLAIDDWNTHGPTMDSYKIHMQKGKFYDIKLEYFQSTGGSIVKLGIRKVGEKLLEAAIDVARKSDMAIVFAGTSAQYETEGKDRDDLVLPNDQDKLISEVAKANKNTIVVMITGSPVLMEGWINDVDGLVQAWFGGDEAGNAIADVLLGKYNPSGKLPMTFPVKWEDCSAYGSYKKQDSVSVYSDGIFVGYRWFDKNNIRPLFPFGYGLSYTTFSYNNMAVETEGDSYKITFKVENTGKVEGVEIPQLYVHDPDTSVLSPPKELKRFDRLTLKPRESKEVTFILKRMDFAHYDPDKEAWYTHPGTYDILIGSSSRDIKLQTKVTIE